MEAHQAEVLREFEQCKWVETLLILFLNSKTTFCLYLSLFTDITSLTYLHDTGLFTFIYLFALKYHNYVVTISIYCLGNKYSTFTKQSQDIQIFKLCILVFFYNGWLILASLEIICIVNYYSILLCFLNKIK